MTLYILWQRVLSGYKVIVFSLCVGSKTCKYFLMENLFQIKLWNAFLDTAVVHEVAQNKGKKTTTRPHLSLSLNQWDSLTVSVFIFIGVFFSIIIPSSCLMLKSGSTGKGLMHGESRSPERKVHFVKVLRTKWKLW